MAGCQRATSRWFFPVSSGQAPHGATALVKSGGGGSPRVAGDKYYTGKLLTGPEEKTFDS
jgi:hypothetical protein